jgi:phosphoribosylglycinamide formyltransferase 1
VTRKRLGILISGRGSNMEALLKAARDPAWPCEPVLVLSNRPDAGGLDKARSYGVPTAAIDHKIYGKDREAFERAVDAELRKAGVELVALAGFMRVLTPWFVNAWAGRLINIHPSLLPLYPGVDTHQRCLDAGDTVHGCTVHQVTAGVDEGPVIGSAEVDVLPGDTPDTLAARVLKAEHLLYPRCLAAVARKGGPRVREDVVADGVTVRLYAPRAETLLSPTN